MVVIGALFATAEAFFRPAYTGLVPDTVPEDQIQPVQALTGVSSQVAEIVGPALATALLLGVGGAAAFAVDAATFALSALLLLRIRTSAASRRPASCRRPSSSGRRSGCRAQRALVADGVAESPCGAGRMSATSASRSALDGSAHSGG